MDKPRIRKQHGPEYGIQRDVVRMLRSLGWHTERLVGMAWQSGLSDLFACHPKFGIRFIEIKQEDHYRFTQAQKCKFPILMNYGCGVWILTEATNEQYQRLFKTPNLWDYLKHSECPSEDETDKWLQELEDESQETI
jgi:hypothetical protein